MNDESSNAAPPENGVSFDLMVAAENVNVRRQNDEDESLAVDIKCRGKIGTPIVARLAGLTVDDIGSLFWDPDDKQFPPRCTGITSIESWAEFENLDGRISGVALKGAKAKRFSFKPIGGRMAEAVFVVQMAGVDDDKIGMICEYLKHDVSLVLENKQQEFDLE